MDQSTIFRYALKHLNEKIVKLDNNLTDTNLNEYQRNLFEKNLTKYLSEYDEIVYMLNNL